MNKWLASMRKGFAICRFEVRNLIFSSNWIVVTIITFLLVRDYISDIITFARAYELTASPAILPFLFSDITFGSLGLLLLIFVVSVFPIRNHLQQNILMKSGCYTWGVAQFFTMIFMVGLWILEVQVFVCILMMDCIELSGWGKALGSMSNGQMLMELGFVGKIQVSMNILLEYTPMKAMLLEAFLIGLTGIIFAEVIFLLDGITNHRVGEVLLTLWCLYVLLAQTIPELSSRLIMRFSPEHWLNIERYINNKQLLLETVGSMCAMIFIMFAINQQIIKKKMIVVE